MEEYTATATAVAAQLTNNYSTSFSKASRLFPEPMRSAIYSIYGLVRVADEIVDSYHGPEANSLLAAFEHETLSSIERSFSPNLIVQAFIVTAKRYQIGAELIRSFFASMAMDLTKKSYSEVEYNRYIYGSAEVIGLMCLAVFCDADQEQIGRLAPGARRLGAAYQKINFLRDLAADYNELGRMYFPGTSYKYFGESEKNTVIQDINGDLTEALQSIKNLPKAAKPAVYLSYCYFEALLRKLESTPVERIKQRRIRIPNSQKLRILAFARLRLTVGKL